MDLFSIRIDIIKQQVRQHLQSCKDILLKYKEGSVSHHEVMSAAAVLKSKNNRYVTETHTLFEKYQTAISEDIVRGHTNLQLECDKIITDLLSAQNINKDTNINVTSKLPKIELKKFHGDILRWHEFWDRFSSSVHNKNIRDVDKLTYLNGCLEGKAKEAIEGLETTDANYSIALKVLQERFGKKTTVIDAHYSELYKIKPKDYSIKEARRIINETERHLRVLSSFGENIEGAHLRSMLIEKFSPDIIQELRMRMTDDESVPAIRKHLEHIVTAKEFGDISVSGEQFSTEVLCTKENYQQRGFNKSKQFTRTPQSNSNTFKKKIEQKEQGRPDNYGKRIKMSCIFCEKPHYSDECKTVSSIEDRKKKLADRCFLCLRRGHRLKDCRMKRRCVHCGEMNMHHRALCPKLKSQSVKTFQTRDAMPSVGILQTAIAKIQNGNNTKYCRLLLDTGSQRTYVTASLAREMELPVKDRNNLLIYTFGSNKPQQVESSIVEIELITQKGDIYKIEANIIPYITGDVRCSKEFIKGEMPDGMADDGSLGGRVDLLIGNDYYHMFVTNRVEQYKQGLYLMDSSFGWVCSGRVREGEEQELTVVTYCSYDVGNHCTKPDLPLRGLQSNMGMLWELENIGITDSPKSTRQEEAVRHFNQTVQFEDQRYQVKWPYITFPPEIPTNYSLALGRLRSVIKRMDRNGLKEYDEVFQQQLRDGIIEVVDNEKVDGPVHYLAHHGVKQPGKKLRVVLDASAKTKDNSSLNECMYKGPLMLEDLTALLIKFRQHPIGIIADVEKAFLQLGLQSEDRDVTRMLWLKNIKEDVHELNLLHLRFRRVPFGIISSPFLLTATIHHHLNQSDPKMNMVEKVAKRCYVDNLVTGTDSKDEAVKLYHDTKKTFEEISMNIRDWNSNSKDFLNEIPEQFRDKNLGMTNVLGMKWNKDKDVLLLKGGYKNRPEDNGNVTKRQVLRTLASVYDPCGIMSPIILPCKIFLQNLWKSKENWDTDLDKEKQEQWHGLRESLRVLDQYEFPRYVNHIGATNLELHCFTDASKDAYAAAVYLRACKQQNVTITLIMSKSRLTPLKNKENLKIPRLELLGCLIGTRLMAYVKETLDLNITRNILWTDSTIVLDWIATNKLLPPFVTRRVEEIKKHKEVEFRYVDSKQNLADIASRKEGAQKIDIWLRGPEFLKEKETKWPKRPHQCDQTKVLAVEEGLVEPENTRNEAELDHIEEEIGREIEFSEGERGISVEENEDTNEVQDNQAVSIEAEEQRKEEVIKEIQKEYYSKEVLGEKTSLKLNLNLFLDDKGILRCKGRMGRSTWSYDMKYPILLPGNCKFTQEIIQEIHTKNYHVGPSHTLSLLRQKYWIPKGRNEVKRVLRKCPQCIKHGGGPFKLPDMPPLPEERLEFTKPFDYTGLDYFGPIVIEVDGKKEKRWVCLYTCLAVRAIYMELVKDLTADECLLALRRFVAARGVPILITSDNAPNFKLTAEVLNSEYCLKEKIRWRFIPELAPWHGGFYERLIGLVKNCLKRTLEKHILTETQMATIIKEVEAVLNTRPLTYVSTEPEYILKPSDFLSFGKCLLMESAESELIETTRISKANLIENWKRGMSILEEFKRMFVSQYLLSLRERYDKIREGRVNVKRIPKLGETVQIKDDSSNRLCWKVGKIIEICKGKDGQCRVARVRVGDKEYTRSIAHLFPLEIYGDEEITEESNINGEKEIDENEEVIEERNISEEHSNREKVDTENEDETVIKERSRRMASQRAKSKIAEWTKLLFNL